MHRSCPLFLIIRKRWPRPRSGNQANQRLGLMLNLKNPLRYFAYPSTKFLTGQRVCKDNTFLMCKRKRPTALDPPPLRCDG